MLSNSRNGDRIWRRELDRRDFLHFLSLMSVATVLPLGGCAKHPVTGERVLVGLSQAEEARIDRRYAPQQYSQDFGAVRDAPLNRYLSEIGSTIAKVSHRPQMQYSHRAVNANYINAYTFPGGSMACTRGILLELRDEAELAALLGHETGHVNARHAAQRTGWEIMAGLALVGVEVALAGSERGDAWVPIIIIAGEIGSSALLASYSRENEREADALGMEYLTRAGYPPVGMVGLAELLVRESKEKPGLLDTMFGSHPMSSERLQNMRTLAKSTYSLNAGAPRQRERYMDNTASLRAQRAGIEAQQRGERHMSRKRLGEAQTEFTSALKLLPRDYAGLCLMAKCQIAQRRHDLAREYIAQARAVYPGEAQAMQLLGVNAFGLRDYAGAIQAFNLYEKALPDNTSVAFLKGGAFEAMNDRARAGREYRRYLEAGGKGGEARHAQARLRAWGLLK